MTHLMEANGLEVAKEILTAARAVVRCARVKRRGVYR